MPSAIGQFWSDPFDESVQDDEVLDTILVLSSTYKIKPGTQLGRIYVTAQIDPRFEIYSVTQPQTGGWRTRISLDHGEKLERIGPWMSDPRPSCELYDFMTGYSELHVNSVTWSAPIKLRDDVDPDVVTIEVALECVCVNQDTAIPISMESIAKFAGEELDDIVPTTNNIMPPNVHENELFPYTQGELDELAVLYDAHSKINYVELVPTIYVWSLEEQRRLTIVRWLLVGGWVVALMAILIWLTHRKHTSKGWRVGLCICLLGLAVGSVSWRVTKNRFYSWDDLYSHEIKVGEDEFQRWVPGIVERRLQETGKPVWVNYHADWDLAHLLNKRRLFSYVPLVEKLNQMEVSLVEVNLTALNPINRNELDRIDRRYSPAFVLYPADYPARPAIVAEMLVHPEEGLIALEMLAPK